MNDPREAPHLRWLKDGVGKIRLYHSSKPDGINIDDKSEYFRLLKEGWCHCKDNVPTLAPEPEIDLDIEIKTPFDDPEPEPEEAPKPPEPKKRGRPKKSGNSFATTGRGE